MENKKDGGKYSVQWFMVLYPVRNAIFEKKLYTQEKEKQDVTNI